MQSQDEELEALRCIHDDIWITTYASNTYVHVPVLYADGEARLILKLPENYPADPIAPSDVEIEGVSSDMKSMLLAMLQLNGLIAEGSTYDRSGESVLYDIILEVREALPWRPTDEMMSELLAEAEVGGEDSDAEAPEWERYE